MNQPIKLAHKIRHYHESHNVNLHAKCDMAVNLVKEKVLVTIKKLVVTSATLVVTGALLVVTRS